MKFRVSFTAALLAAGLPLMSLQAAPLQAVPAVQAGNATQATMLAAGWAGERVVAVGDHGVVLLSDDQGRQWRQARSVPLSTPLTGVSFVDARHGWAVGHWGAILSTADGGNPGRSSACRAKKTGRCSPCTFRCPAGRCGRALVVGADHRGWRQDMDGAAVASAFRSQAGRPQPDGAVCRQPQQPVRHGRAWAGAALRRPGKNWRYLDTGYEGTLWSGAVLADGRLLLGGQRGTLLQGSADGKAFAECQRKARALSHP